MLEISLVAFAMMVLSWLVLPGGPRENVAAPARQAESIDLSSQPIKA